MAPPRRLSNGRSPLVNQQSQITKFFNKTTPSSTSHSNNKEPNPSSSPNPSPNPNPTTPSSHRSVQNKDIKSDTTKRETASLKVVSYGKEVLNNGIRVYWPLDQSWYKGHVKGFDELSGKHKVRYDDGDEEELYLCKEKIEWVDEKVKSLRRLRKAVVEEEDDDEKRDESSVDRDVDGDDSTDEDWGKNVGKEVTQDELEDMALDDDDEDDDVKFTSSTPDTGSKKRKAGAKEISGSSKKNKRIEKVIPSSDGGGNILEQIDKGDSE